MILQVKQEIYNPFIDAMLSVVLIDEINQRAYCEVTLQHQYSEDTCDYYFEWYPFSILNGFIDMDLLYKERLLKCPYQKDCIRPFEGGPSLASSNIY